MKPAHVQLLVEIADSSLAYDLGANATYCAGLGLHDYWVINARTLVTRIHRQAGNGAWGDVCEHSAQALMTPLAIPALAVRLADLGLTAAPDDEPA